MIALRSIFVGTSLLLGLTGCSSILGIRDIEPPDSDGGLEPQADPAYVEADAQDPVTVTDTVAPDAGEAGTLMHEDAGADAGADAGPVCTIGGKTVPANTVDPGNPCQSCQPDKSATAWTDVAEGTACGEENVCHAGDCLPGCAIGGAYYAAGAVNGANACQLCAPETSTTAWSNAHDGTSCGAGKVCQQGACDTQCFIGGVVVEANSANPGNPCETCQPAKSTTAWSSIADGQTCGNGQICAAGKCGTQCLIAGHTYTSGAKNPTNACQICQPGANTIDWTTSNPPNLGASCGSCGGKVKCDGTCSIPTPATFGKSCNSCGGTVQCNGTCSTSQPANLGASCNSCGGKVLCNGSCSTSQPANLGAACGSCGGTVQCDGSCSVPTPANYGSACNSCGGTVQCNGTCSTAQPSNLGAACGSCGGTVQCNGSCSVATPGNLGAACNSCGGVVQCNGTCSTSQPGNLGQSCNSCGGVVQCNGTCSTSQPGNLGASCGSCGGTVQCSGSCSVATPGNFGSIQERTSDQESFSCCWIDYQKGFGGSCSAGWVYDHVTITKISGGGACELVAEPAYGSTDCSVNVRFHNNGTEGAKCQVTVYERRACD